MGADSDPAPEAGALARGGSTLKTSASLRARLNPFDSQQDEGSATRLRPSVRPLSSSTIRQRQQEQEPTDEPSEQPRPGSSRYVIRIGSPFKWYWDLAQITVLAYVWLAVPLQIGFGLGTHGFAMYCDVAVDLYFFVDIILNFFSGIKVYEAFTIRYIEDLPSIARRYICTWFLLDLLAAVPVDYVLKAQDGTLGCSLNWNGCNTPAQTRGSALKLLKALRMFRLLKLIKLARFVKLVQHYEQELRCWGTFTTLAKICLSIFMLSHWCACTYGSILEWDGEDLKEKYCTSFYWAVQSLTTVGYGDLQLSTLNGQFVSIVVMLLGSITFAALMSAIFSILNPDAIFANHEQIVSFVLTYLRRHDAPPEVATRVLDYFRETLQPGATERFKEQEMMEALPPALRIELFENLYLVYVVDVSFFRKFELDQIQLKELVMMMYPVTAKKGEFVYQRDDTATGFYIQMSGVTNLLKSIPLDRVSKGTLVKQPPAEEIRKTVHEGDFFGEMVSIGMFKRLFEYAVGVTDISMLYVPVAKFWSFLEHNKAMHQEFLCIIFARLMSERCIEDQTDILFELELEQFLGPHGGVRKDICELIMDPSGDGVISTIAPRMRGSLMLAAGGINSANFMNKSIREINRASTVGAETVRRLEAKAAKTEALLLEANAQLREEVAALRSAVLALAQATEAAAA
eukprot:CAMPEP_0118929934 /NCGR_PEP_ID=MMETSP1169-20130426/6789_1 /TAXON_ID=36882 /ORGANISM="Pyramimonas obovata, Strain CCMP722" /LENGTH=685 /DNA_ID=CAMNT_0006872211 /DNA_START=148 /DNA_END=2201 /DNA_ORIENTATION=+